ncbi:hypothetical protein CTheo_5402 [Ceratobasidium theobromae]|uniref:gamma-glutamylcyclotransferase n=1 Tax=Ceratobasidium theobromae TaxID=1582974 RepID=A0A5N5QI55_9AGAM|nr:hypothetical protein CTheo_5402 [Ceratobasidium theobromae]
MSYDDKIVLLPNTADAPNLLQTLHSQGFSGYFAYGSNLSVPQMLFRCPDSPYICVAVLEGWRWIIGTRGYATIVRSPHDVVYGYLYLLTPEDEKALDGFEGPFYKKVEKSVLIGPGILGRDAIQDFKTYVYIEDAREGVPKSDYINRLNTAFSNATAKGVPSWYIEKYIQYRSWSSTNCNAGLSND